ncbi:MAG: hypothetical protein K2Y16_03340 [Burkholderiales bacterium]|nr:hypothetical protein [Burkholderiales bacterium]
MTANRRIDVRMLGEAEKRRDGDRLVTFIPMRVKKRGFRKLLIGPKPTGAALREETHPDSPLIKAVARAFSWQRLLDEDSINDTNELAQREKLDRALVNETLRFTLLAPQIIEAILAGRQPRTLTLQHLRRGRL